MDLRKVVFPKMLNPVAESYDMRVRVGSARRFRAVPDSDSRNNQMLTLNAWSQTNTEDFLVLNDLHQNHRQTQNVERLELKIKALEEELKAVKRLLSQIHATSVQSSASFRGQLLQPNIINNNTGLNNTDAIINICNRSGPSRIMDAANSSRQCQYIIMKRNLPADSLERYSNNHYVFITSKKQNGNQSVAGVGTGSENEMVSIGPNNTRIRAKVYASIKWKSPSKATRKLLEAIFDRKILATHSMTGKPSPAFKGHDKPVKKKLDPLIIADIVHAVKLKCNATEREVHLAITTKCADESKTLKLKKAERNKENLN